MPSVPSVRSPRGLACVRVAGTGPCTLGLGNLQQPRFPAFALRIKIGAGVSGVPIFDPPQPQGPLSQGAPCRKHKHNPPPFSIVFLKKNGGAGSARR